MTDYIKVKNYSGLVRDKNTGVILNINNKEAEAARKRKEKLLLDEEQNRKRDDEIEELKSDISDIKNLLTKLVEKL